MRQCPRVYPFCDFNAASHIRIIVCRVVLNLRVIRAMLVPALGRSTTTAVPLRALDNINMLLMLAGLISFVEIY